MNENCDLRAREKIKNNKMTSVGKDHARVFFPPPLIHATAIIAGFGCTEFSSFTLPVSLLLTWLGAGLLVVSLFIASSAYRQFVHNNNPVPPNQSINKLMSSGPFRYTRNPLYLALALMHGGVGLLASNFWVLLTLPLALLVVRYYVIAREEAYLSRRFGQSYLDYQMRVRRWF